jgi:hypothetical protein
LRWGHGSELSSNLTRDEQARPAATGQWDWEERIRLRHTRRVESAWSRAERHSWSGASEGRAVGWTGRVSQQVGDGFRYGLGYQERRATAAGEHSVTRTGGPEAAFGALYARLLRLDASLGLDFERRIVTGEPRGPVSVLEERALFDAGGSVLLLRAGVRAASLRVESPDRTLLFVENVDYRVIDTGSTFQLVVLPGGRLRPGDAVLLSYTYDPPVRGDADAHSLRLNVVAGYRGFTARHTRRRRDADGSGIAVTARTSAFDEDETSLDWDRTTRLGRTHAIGTLTHRRLDGVRQRVADVRADWSGGPTRFGQPTVAAGHSRRTGESAPLDLDDAAFGWTVMPLAGLTTVARLELRRSRFDAQSLESTRGFTFDADWRFGALETQVRYGFASRRDGVDRDAQRVMLRLSRRF